MGRQSRSAHGTALLPHSTRQVGVLLELGDYDSCFWEWNSDTGRSVRGGVCLGYGLEDGDLCVSEVGGIWEELNE